MQNYEDLTVWTLAHELLLEIYNATASFPAAEKFTLTAQLRRSALSIGSNLAEGCGRFGPNEMRRFVSYAAGSSKEVEYQLTVAHDLGYLDRTTHKELTERIQRIQRMLRGLHNSLT